MTAGARERAVGMIPSPLGGDAESRVLFVTNMWPEEERPWYGTFIHTQARSLERLGTAVDVMYVRGHVSKWAYAAGMVEALRLNAGPRWEVVHAHYGHSAAAARFQVRLPLVISYCGDDLLGTPDENGRATMRSRAEVAVFRQLARVAAATITKSRAMERKLPPATRRRNHVIPNGVDIDLLRPLPRGEARSRLGWTDDERVALFVGNPEIPRKNYPLAAAACERLGQNGSSARLQVAWGVDPAEIPVMMSAADALVLTSLSEGSPNVVKEAMACELPVVATPAGDVPERLDGVAGCYVARPDADDVANGLRIAFEHGRSPEARAAVSELSLQRVAERVRGVYAEVRP
jgi:glycosyltransferase involved in cell wall biosynthesis